jgi:hypothetical protein
MDADRRPWIIRPTRPWDALRGLRTRDPAAHRVPPADEARPAEAATPDAPTVDGARREDAAHRVNLTRPAVGARSRTPTKPDRGLARCRRAWAFAQLTPALFSTMPWIWCLALAPTAVAVIVGLAIVAALVGVQPWALRVLHGVRPASPAERDAVLEALIPVRALRGRGQPSIWIRTRPGPLEAITRRDLVIPNGTVQALLRGRLYPDAFAAAVVRTIAERTVRAGVAVYLVDVYCLPWTFLAAGLGWVGRQPLIHPLWVARPIVLTIAIVQELQAGEPTVAATVLAIPACTYLHPYWRTRCHEAVRRYADSEVARQGLGAPSTS